MGGVATLRGWWGGMASAVLSEAVELNAASREYSEPIISQTAEATRDAVVKVL